ncbi:MAG: ROK family protein [Paludibacter sp.]|nr:ROK family protein [Paludibacter sp.]
MKQVAIGIDIGGTNTVLGLVDQNGNVLAKDYFSTAKYNDITEYTNKLSGNINKLLERLSQIEVNLHIIGIGIGAPNANYYSGTIEHAPNLSFKGVIPFVSLLKEKFPYIQTITLTNDANATAIGEMLFGGAIGMRNFVMYTLGTGVGSGLVVNGNLVYGQDGFAGECGHTMLIPNGRLCGCGVRGHLEAYCSATGMKRTAFELLAKYNPSDSLLANYTYKQLQAKNIYDAAIQGDAVALEVFRLTGYWLGIGLANTVHHLSPEAIFLFGGPVSSGELLIKPTVESLERHLLPVFRQKVKVLPSQLNCGDAAILGASALAWKELNLPQFFLVSNIREPKTKN